MHALPAFKGQDNTGKGDQSYGSRKLSAHSLSEKEKSDHGSGHDLKVAKKRGIGGAAAADAQHQKNGSQDIQQHHSHRIGKIISAQALFLFLLFIAEEVHNAHASPCSQIEKGRHKGRGHTFQKDLGKWRIDSVKYCRHESKKNGSDPVFQDAVSSSVKSRKQSYRQML